MRRSWVSSLGVCQVVPPSTRWRSMGDARRYQKKPHASNRPSYLTAILLSCVIRHFRLKTTFAGTVDKFGWVELSVVVKRMRPVGLKTTQPESAQQDESDWVKAVRRCRALIYQNTHFPYWTKTAKRMQTKHGGPSVRHALYRRIT